MGGRAVKQQQTKKKLEVDSAVSASKTRWGAPPRFHHGSTVHTPRPFKIETARISPPQARPFMWSQGTSAGGAPPSPASRTATVPLLPLRTLLVARLRVRGVLRGGVLSRAQSASSSRAAREQPVSAPVAWLFGSSTATVPARIQSPRLDRASTRLSRRNGLPLSARSLAASCTLAALTRHPSAAHRLGGRGTCLLTIPAEVHATRTETR